jgi:hypothetical protein
MAGGLVVLLLAVWTRIDGTPHSGKSWTSSRCWVEKRLVYFPNFSYHFLGQRRVYENLLPRMYTTKSNQIPQMSRTDLLQSFFLPPTTQSSPASFSACHPQRLCIGASFPRVSPLSPLLSCPILVHLAALPALRPPVSPRRFNPQHQTTILAVPTRWHHRPWSVRAGPPLRCAPGVTSSPRLH